MVVQSPPLDGLGDDGPPELTPAGPPPEAGRKPHAGEWTRARVVRRAVELVVLSGAAVFLLRRVGHLGEVAGAFDHLHWHWLFLAVAAEAGSVVCLSWVQQRLLRVGALPVGVPDLVPVTLASNAVSLSLPAGTLFAEGYTFRQYQWLGASQVLAIWSQLSAGALATAALAAVAVAGAAAAPGLRLELLPVLTFVLAGALVAAALFRRASLLGALIGAHPPTAPNVSFPHLSAVTSAPLRLPSARWTTSTRRRGYGWPASEWRRSTGSLTRSC